MGAIAVLILETGMRRGFRPAFAAGTGAAAADLTYAALAAVAGPPIAAALSSFTRALQLGSAALLLAIGLRGLWAAKRNAAGPPAGSNLARGALRTFWQFLGLTLLNPLTMAYFAALVLGRGLENSLSAAGRLAFVAGAWLASWSWQSLLAASGALAQRLLSRRAQQLTTILGNAVVIGFGLRILAGLFG
ncbi:MAG TPA: LysE family transporter [Anaerolineales bacterium]